jgi:predicted acyl esterase
MSLYIPFEKGYGTYTGAIRTSRYVEGSDGTKLAVDIYLPADGPGEAVSGPFPLVLHAGKGSRRMGEGVDAFGAGITAVIVTFLDNAFEK